MNARTAAVVLGLALALGSVGVGGASAHYTPAKGDRFAYNELITLTNGVGDYTGYTESQTINGSLGVTGVSPNGTESAYYYNIDYYVNNTPGSATYLSSGTFTFSASTFEYVNGTDGQTGYNGSNVWFYIDNSLGNGSGFNLLDTPFTVVSTDYDYHLGTAAGAYVTTIYAESSGTGVRDDVYGMFTYTYTWKMYFDPGTGYIVGYLYTEQDSNASGDGFLWTDQLTVTSTSYPLTPGAAPASGSGSSGGISTTTLVIVALVLVIVVVVIAALAISRSRRRTPLPRHSSTGAVSYAPPPMGPAPPPINLTPGGQPAVQQIVIKETVKVNCAYCGALIDSTVTKCPYCGATRS